MENFLISVLDIIETDLSAKLESLESLMRKNKREFSQACRLKNKLQTSILQVHRQRNQQLSTLEQINLMFRMAQNAPQISRSRHFDSERVIRDPQTRKKNGQKMVGMSSKRTKNGASKQKKPKKTKSKLRKFKKNKLNPKKPERKRDDKPAQGIAWRVGSFGKLTGSQPSALMNSRILSASFMQSRTVAGDLPFKWTVPGNLIVHIIQHV